MNGPKPDMNKYLCMYNLILKCFKQEMYTLDVLENNQVIKHIQNMHLFSNMFVSSASIDQVMLLICLSYFSMWG